MDGWMGNGLQRVVLYCAALGPSVKVVSDIARYTFPKDVEDPPHLTTGQRTQTMQPQSVHITECGFAKLPMYRCLSVYIVA